MSLRLRSAAAAAALFVAAPVFPQQPATVLASMPGVGDTAPDFSARGATRYGLLRDPVHLSDYRGQTVVLWLFIKARTRG